MAPMSLNAPRDYSPPSADGTEPIYGKNKKMSSLARQKDISLKLIGVNLSLIKSAFPATGFNSSLKRFAQSQIKLHKSRELSMRTD